MSLSISIFGIPATAYSLLMNFRMCWSWTKSLPKRCLFANQRERQFSVMPMRNPVGLVFCPMRFLFHFHFFRASLPGGLLLRFFPGITLFLRRFFLGDLLQDNAQVAGPAKARIGPAHGARLPA